MKWIFIISYVIKKEHDRLLAPSKSLRNINHVWWKNIRLEGMSVQLELGLSIFVAANMESERER